MQAGVGVCGYTGLGQPFLLSRQVVTGTTLRQASLSFVTAAADSPASTFIEGRLAGGVEVARVLPRNGEGRFAGFAVQAAARLELDNQDGGLDAWQDLHEFRDRPIRLRVARTTRGADAREQPPALSEFITAFAGRVVNLQAEGTKLTVTVEDGTKRLDQPIQKNLYLGHGGINGGPDLAGLPKPLSYGLCYNITPTLVDILRLIYQVHDGEVLRVNGVYDRGAALQPTRDFATWAELEQLQAVGDAAPIELLPGYYATCLAQGYFRLGGVPTGKVTADVEGDGRNDGPVPWSGGILFSGGVGWSSAGEQTFSRYAGGIIHRILVTRAGYGQAEVERARLAQFDKGKPYPQGLHVSSSVQLSVRDACSLLADSVCAVVTRSRIGQFSLVALDGPAPGSAIEIDDSNRAEDGIESLPLPYGAAWPTVRIRYGANWSPMTEAEIAADLDPARREFLRRPGRYVDRNDPVITALLPDRPPLTIESLLVYPEHALAIAADYQRFYAPRRRMFRDQVRGLGFRLDWLDTARVTSPRFGLAAGRLLQVVGIAERPGEYVTELTLFG